MKRFALLLMMAISVAGCSSTKLGAMLYCPHGQACELKVSPPEVKP